MEPPPLRHALLRGVPHVILGVALAIALFIFPRVAVLAAVGTVIVVFLALEMVRLYIPSLRGWFSFWFIPFMRKPEENRLTGASYLLIGCLITMLVFPRDIAGTAIFFLALGDPAATVFGVWKGRIKLGDKTFEGHLTCLFICLLTGAVIFLVRGAPPLAVAVVGAAFATLFQALPLRLNDNLTIPIGSAAAMLGVNMLV
jgi:glycerol-3-phosphate acyltransferase PlsY